MLPRLRSTIRLPADKHLLQQLEFCVRKLLCREKDKDVVATIRKVRHNNGDWAGGQSGVTADMYCPTGLKQCAR